jgi:O-antigen/teichoic acid export membrane protein
MSEEELLTVETAEEILEVHLPVQQKVRRNVLFTIGARIGFFLTRMWIPPFVLGYMSLTVYGVWSSIFILVSYLGMSTMGISNVYIKYIAEYNARREYKKANELLSTGLLVTVPLCLILFAGMVIWWPTVAHWMKLTPVLEDQAREAVLIVVGVFLSSLSLTAFTDVLSGMQEIAAAQVIWIISYVAETILIVVLVSRGRGLRGMAEAFLVRNVLQIGLSIFWAFWKFKWMRISPRFFSRESLKSVMHFGGLVQLQSMLSIFLGSVERLAGWQFIGLEAAALFDLAKKWPSSVAFVPTAFFAALIPAASHVDAEGTLEARRTHLQSLYMKGARYANLCTAYFCGLMALLPGPIMKIWLARPLKDAVALFVILTLATHLSMLTGPGTSILRGMARVYDEFFNSVPNLLALALFLPISHWYYGQWTPLGIGFSVLASTGFATLLLLMRVHHVLKLSWSGFLTRVLVPGLLPYGVGAVLAWPVTHIVSSLTRLQGAGVLVGTGCVYSLLCMILLYGFCFDDAEKKQMMELFHRLRRPQLPVGAEL